MDENTLFSVPNLFTAKRILVVQPHYDDNDIQIGGTLAKLAENGAELHYLTVTDDLVGVVDQSLSWAEMETWLKDNQYKAGEVIGVNAQYWLGYPDAGKYDFFDVRRDIIQHIRRIRPDFLITNDPWLPYEFHNDHIITGQAAVSAASLYGLTRLTTTAEIDKAFEKAPFDLTGIAFYTTSNPNTTIDITDVWEKKKQAISQYSAQFSEEDMVILLDRMQKVAQYTAREEPFTHAEKLKVMYPWHLHGFAEAWKV